ncbi:OLC1v1022539C1 [Oldenlandia corymbosa var. corymbosa]|uniref:OLC1v1022539C1 n=1 Tax=Oldenlandia corymbosa var. corymbosa TaxID=529605 RepID=A0AAV1C0W7_OLDCO|nr:OLC1v1022539C1 [Oldenlandia corymbosa var. corymbosa]
MEAAVEVSFLNRSTLVTVPRTQFHAFRTGKWKLPPSRNRIFGLRTPTLTTPALHLHSSSPAFFNSRSRSSNFGSSLVISMSCRGGHVEDSPPAEAEEIVNLRLVEGLLRRGFVLVVMVCGIMVAGCRKGFAVEGFLNAGTNAALETGGVVLRSSWPKVLQVLMLFREQGLVLAALLSLSAFFSMAETSITTLWPWKVRELAEKESEDGVFKLLRSDVTRFLTTILIGTTVVNIGATALVTEAATAIFGEAGVSAATGVMTVAILLLTEITPKSIAVHNATDVARFVVRPVAWLSYILYPVGRVVTYLSMGMLKLLGLKDRSEPYVTEDELKLMLRGAELSGAIEEEEQDMIENVLEIKDTDVEEVMTPLVNVVAIDASSTLIDFHELWVTHQYSRVPVFEQRIDNIVGIAYAMDLLDFVQKGELLESSTVGDMAHKPAYFVPDSMSVWNLLREFRIRKVHMAVVLNEYGGTIGIVTLEDVVEEIVGEIFDENDSKEEIQKKTGYIVMRPDGSYDVDADTSIDQLSEDLNIKIPEGHQYELVSGFVCEVFGYIPRTGETTEVVLERENEEEHSEFNEAESERSDKNSKEQVFKIEILAGNARKVSAVRFEPLNRDDIGSKEKTKGLMRLVPKIRKKKKGGGSNDSDKENNAIENEVPFNLDSDEYVIPEHVDNHEHHHHSKQ